MLYTVRGLKRSFGNYEGYDYDNILIHCDCPDDGKMLVGEPVEIVKIKAAVFSAICDRHKMDIRGLKGSQIRVFYDKFGKAEDFDIVAFPDK